MQCGTGCSDCCHVRLTITGVEAAAIRAHVASWSSQERRNLAEFGPDGPPQAAERCAALDPAGRCKIYDARPVVCRSHGVPIRLRHGALPVVQACHRNFRHTVPDPDCILDQTTLSAMLLAVDVAERRAAGPAEPDAGWPDQRAPDPPATGEPGPRVDLAQLLADLAAI
jgi:hypothetical protein